MKIDRLTPLSIGLATLLFLAAAVVGFSTLSAIARPAQFADRLAKVRAVGDSQASRTPVGLQRFPARAVCTKATVAGSRELQQELAKLANRSQLTVVELHVAPDAPERALAQLASIEVLMSAQGSQAEVLGLLADLEQASPMVFLDHIELRPKGDVFELKILGRAFCSISARQ